MITQDQEHLQALFLRTNRSSKFTVTRQLHIEMPRFCELILGTSPKNYRHNLSTDSRERLALLCLNWFQSIQGHANKKKRIGRV